ncbi:hypothetical protein CHISP_3455 [Chitinispirillum alkaliphilum]|nr:hypothetical protein CHISP_3455 [Chitinispirillum alkaliphilum]
MNNGTNILTVPFFCSWSGGKDSALALYRSNGKKRCESLITVLDETKERTRSHYISAENIKRQAESIGIPQRFISASWDDYEREFKNEVRLYKDCGVADGVFGDIDIEQHREWVERVCGESETKAHFPLWGAPRTDLVNDFINLGFRAIIVVVNRQLMPERFIGRIVDQALIQELQSEGVDVCGENGEFHTFVLDGPLFCQPIRIVHKEIISNGNYTFIDFTTD